MSVFDDAAAALADIWAQMQAETLSPEDAAPLISAELESVAPSQFIQFTKIEQVMGRITGLFFVTEAPDPTLGAPGSSAIDLVNKQFYGPKDAVTGWPAGLQFGPVEGMAFTSGTNTWTGTQTFSTPLLLSAGTASLPSLTLTGDLNTGIWSPGADTLAISTGGSERFRVTSAGNVGIGTTSPSEKLDVVGNAKISSGSSFYWGDATSQITAVNGGAMRFLTGTASEKMRIESGGNVGIGTTAPSSFSGYTSLTVNNATNGGLVECTNGTRTIRMQSQASGSALIGTTTSHTLGFMAAGVERITVDTNGNVGIGTTSPVNRLQVTYGSAGSVPAAGASAHGFVVGESGFGLATGALNSGNAYLQATRWDGSAVNYNLLLQPSGGNVGIGTSSPSYKLHTAVNTANGDGLYLTNANNGASLALFVNGTSGSGISGWANSTVLEAVPFSSGGLVIGAYTGNIMFQTNGRAEAMRITAAGDVCIGTTTAVQRLTIGSTSATSAGINLRTTQTDFSIVPSNSAAGGVTISTSWVSGGQGPLIFANSSGENVRISGSGELLINRTSASGYGKLNVEGGADFTGGNVLFGRDAGNVLIGSATNSLSTKLFLQGEAGIKMNAVASARALVLWNEASSDQRMIAFYTGSGQVFAGGIECASTTTLYYTSSDARMKKNIVDSDGTSDVLDALQVRQFDWIETDEHQRYGFIAQELVNVVPEAVSVRHDQDEMMSVDYSKLVPILVKEIQSLRARVSDLESE